MVTKNEGKSEDNQSFYRKENGLPAKLKKKYRLVMFAMQKVFLTARKEDIF